MASFDVTRRALSLGARDSVTGWPAKSYAESTIKGSFDPATARAVAMNVGMPLNSIPYYSRPFYTAAYVRSGDHIEHSIVGEVELVTVSPVTYGDENVFYACQCSEILSPADRAASSGTWHTDSDALKTDPRNRTKTWLDAYIAYAVCDYQIVFAGGDYRMEREFTDNGLEIVSAVDLGPATPVYAFDHKPYKFTEQITITNTAKDTSTLTATNILESFEQAIRHVATDYPIGSIRRIRSTEPQRVDIGGMWLWQNTITIDYDRANGDFLPTYPSFSYGLKTSTTKYTYIYEGDILSGGLEGTWTESGAGSTAVDSENNLALTGDTTVETMTAGTDLGLSTTTYTKARIRYKTTGGATLTVATDDETILNAQSSSTWTIATVSLTGGNTLDHLSIHNAAHAGVAYLDCIEIYKDSYIIPNVTRRPIEMKLKDAVLQIPGFAGNIVQALGSDLKVVQMTCDLDIEPSGLTWKRPQTTTPKNDDVTNMEIFMELEQALGNQTMWVWLDVGDPPVQMKARLLHYNVESDGDSNLLNLWWVEYRHGSAANETTVERYGLSL